MWNCEAEVVCLWWRVAQERCEALAAAHYPLPLAILASPCLAPPREDEKKEREIGQQSRWSAITRALLWKGKYYCLGDCKDSVPESPLSLSSFFHGEECMCADDSDET